MEEIRQQALDALRRHKSGWVTLGKILLEVSTSGEFKAWGFDQFKEYFVQELGLTPNTARGMMTAYEYIKANEPSLLNSIETGETKFVPDFHTITTLAKAKQKGKLEGDKADKIHAGLFEDKANVQDAMQDMNSELKAANEPVMDEIRKEAKKVRSLAKQLNKKIHETSAFTDKARELADELLKTVETFEV